MRLHASVIVRRRSTLDSSFLGRRGVGRGHPTRLTSRLMRGVHDRTFAFSGRTSLQRANVQRARVNPRSGTRTTQRKAETEPFAAQAQVPAVGVVTPCGEPISVTYLRLPPNAPHTARTFTVLPTTEHLDSEERCTTTLGRGGPCPYVAFHKMYCGSRHHVLRPLSRSISRRHHHGTRAALPANDDFQWFPRFFNLVEQHALLSAALRKLDAAEPRASRKRRRDFLASRHRPTTQDQQRTHCAGVLEDSFLPGDLYHFEEVRHQPCFFSSSSSRATASRLGGSPLLTAESRAIMTVSFDASGKCACQPGMTRRTRF